MHMRKRSCKLQDVARTHKIKPFNSRMLVFIRSVCVHAELYLFCSFSDPHHLDVYLLISDTSI